MAYYTFESPNTIKHKLVLHRKVAMLRQSLLLSVKSSVNLWTSLQILREHVKVKNVMNARFFFTTLLQYGQGMSWNLVLLVQGAFSSWSNFFIFQRFFKFSEFSKFSRFKFLFILSNISKIFRIFENFQDSQNFQ